LGNTRENIILNWLDIAFGVCAVKPSGFIVSFLFGAHNSRLIRRKETTEFHIRKVNSLYHTSIKEFSKSNVQLSYSRTANTMQLSHWGTLVL